MYNAKILADSMSPHGDRITTMKITFPRIVLAEFNTHRMFSRNSASSRAIPFNKMVQMVEKNPFIPIAWQKDHKGMQGTEYFADNENIEGCINEWLKARDYAVEQATRLNEDLGYGGVTKQLCNRLLEPFMWHTVIVTATEWENFFKLRCPQYIKYVEGAGVGVQGDVQFRSKKDAINRDSKLSTLTNLEWLQMNKSQADIHIQAITELMWDAYNESTPKQLQVGQWHIPFGDNIDIDWCNDKMQFRKGTIEDLMVEIATARCARISYETLGDNPKIDYEADIKLHDRLLAEGHMSPFEHCAKVPEFNQDINSFGWEKGITHKDIDDYFWSGNFKGFIQYRQLLS